MGFKIGDWIIFDKSKINLQKESPPMEIIQIIKKVPKNTLDGQPVYFYYFGDGSNLETGTEDFFRKATQKEIKTYQFNQAFKNGGVTK